MKTAVIHDWLVTYGGADRVLEQILACYPDADLFSLVDFLPPEQRGFILNKPVTTSFIQHLPFARKSFRKYLPLMPLAVEQFDLSPYDLVISSSHAIAKGVITGPDQLHICLCHSPMRYAWDLQHQYLQEAGLDRGVMSWPTRWLLHKARSWDYRTSNGVDEFIAISHFIARRVWKTYRRESTIIYPPVDVDSLCMSDRKDDFYLTLSRLVPYKKVKLIVEAFRMMPHKKLVVIGDGPQFKSIKAVAGKNVSMLGYQSSEVVHDYLQRANGFIFAAEEDFGISVLEAQACGTPIIAYGKGGSLETVRELGTEEPTGLFFYEQSCEALLQAVSLFEMERSQFKAAACRKNAMRFSADRFRREFFEFCECAFLKLKARIGARYAQGLTADVVGEI
jgi:glycosyltransferase involved in cell wall biosynthesis